MPAAESGAGRRVPRWLIPVLGYTVSVACLVWVYRGFDWDREIERLATTNWTWVVPAVVADILVYVCQGWRWSVLLVPVAQAPVIKSTQAIYIGLFANEVLPLRSGEIIRCYLQRKWTGLPLSVVLSSAVIERLMDGVWLVLGFWLAGMYVNLPGLLVQGGRVLVVVLLAVAALVAMAVMYKGHAHEAVARSRWGAMLRHVVDGVHLMGASRTFITASVISLLYLALQVLPVYFLMRAYRLEMGPWEAAVVLVVLRLGTIIPQAPGNVGSFQALTIIGLGLFGMERTEAAGFATLLFLVVTVPLWLAGFIALLATRMRLEEIHRDAQEHFAAER